MSEQWLTDDLELTLREMCEACAMPAEFIEALVRHGVLEPRVGRPRTGHAPQWRFTPPALVRARKAARLNRDLGINLAGVALALDLLDELEQTRAELARISRLQRR